MSIKARLAAAPNRVVCRFPPKKEVSRGGIIIAETSQLRPELAEILDVGEAIGEEETACARWLREMQRAGKRIPVSVESGTRYWRETYEADEGLADVRVYHVTQLASALVEHQMYHEGE